VAVRAAFVLFAALLLWAPFPLGSNRPWAWTLLELGVFAAAALWTLGWMLGQAGPLGVLRAAAPALGVFAAWLLYLALHWLPMPISWVSVLSPQAGALHSLVGAEQATLSIDPHASFTYWLKSCAYAVAFFLALAFAGTRSRARLLAFILVLSGLVQATYGGLMHLSGTNLEIFGATIHHAAHASGGFVNRNHLAGFLEITLALGVGLMLGALQETGQRSWRQFWRDTAQLLLSPKAPLRIFLVVMVIALVMTRSRMGNTAFLSSLLIAGAAALILRRHATRGSVIFIASLIALDVFIIGAWFGVEKTVERIRETTTAEVEERVEPAVYAVDMVRDYPVFGAGAGSFYTAFTRYRGPGVKPFYDHAHNDYLQILAETGIVGAALVGSLALWALVLGVLALSRRRDPLARGLAVAVVMGVCALGIHSTVDFNLQIPANALAFVVLLAYGWVALYLERAPSGRPPPSRDAPPP
jgi:O-antigen ligase